MSYIMERKPSNTNNLTEKRFRVTLFLLRLGGVSICVDSPSRINRVYNSVATICAYSVFLAMIMDYVKHRDDLQQAMKTFRVILSCVLIFWLHVNVR
jgi:hypothetical protein